MNTHASPVRVPRPRTSLPRGVHKKNELYDGQPIYIAVSHGYVLDQWRQRLGESEDDVILGLADILDAVGPEELPARPDYLALVRDDVDEPPATTFRPASSAYRSFLLSPRPRLRATPGVPQFVHRRPV